MLEVAPPPRRSRKPVDEDGPHEAEGKDFRASCR
jgi:hypothetical protein